MLVELPVLFSADVTKKNARNSHRLDFKTKIQIDIKEIDALDAPVAVKGLASRGSLEDHTRWYDGSHWMLDSTMGAAAEEWETFLNRSNSYSRIVNAAIKGTYFTKDGCDTSWLPTAVPEGGRSLGQPFDPDLYRIVTNSNLDEQTGRMAKLADSLMIVDGGIYSRCPTPVFFIANPPYGGGWWNIDLLNTLDVPRSISNGNVHVFNLDRMEEMLAFADLMDPQIRHANDLQAPEILLPEAFNAPDEQISAVVVTHGAVTLLERYVKDLSEDQGINWFKLRSALEKALASPESHEIENLVAVASQLADAFDQEPTRLSGMGALEDIDRAAVMLKDVRNRWEMRPISLEYGV